MTWFSILKETRQIASTGIRTKLGTTPLTMGNEDDDKDCCTNALDDFYRLMQNVARTDYSNFNVEEFDKYGPNSLIAYAESMMERLGKYMQSNYIEEMEIFCNEIEKLMANASDYYWDIVDDGHEKGNYNKIVREAWIIFDEITEIVDEWDACEGNE